MTHTPFKTHENKRHLGACGTVLLLLTVFFLLLIIRNTEVAVRSVSKGLSLCVKSVIPSLFPFMVLSELAVSSDLIAYLPRRLLAPLRRLFGLSEAGCASLLLGLLCGAPVGARCVSLSVSRGEMKKEEAARVLTASVCPSSAFVIGAVGVTLLHDRKIGTVIYFSALLAALVSGILFRLFGGDVSTPSDFSPTRAALHPSVLFTNAVANAAKNILLVSAYVVFFSAITGALFAALSSFCIPPTLSAFVFCLLELSGGVASTAALDSPIHKILLCAFAVGWSGISVHFQIKALCDESNISMRPYLLSKLLQGVLCLAFTYLSLCF